MTGFGRSKPEEEPVRSIEATFDSFCPECHEWIREGDLIVRSDDHGGRYVHEECE